MKLKSYTKKDRYGNMTSFEFYEGASVDMGDIPPMMEGIPDHPGEPKGTDTVPAWLTPGEFVMNAEATRMFEPQIEEMNNAGRAVQAAQGGTIPQYEADGGPVYLAEGGGGFLDNLLNMFTSSPQEPVDTSKVADPDSPLRTLSNEDLVKAAKAKIAAANQNKPDSKIPLAPTMQNAAYMNLIKDTEGFMDEAYLDSAGVPTIGYGFTKGVKMGDTMDKETADKRLVQEMAVADKDYNNLVDADLNPNQQAAVKSLLYNIGGPQFANSKARAALNAGDFDAFQKEAAEFRMADGKVIPGLENRRAKELSLFNTPYVPLKDAVSNQVNPPKIDIAPVNPDVRSINKFGKTTDYQKVNDKWYRIKPDGSLARDPATGLVSLNLNTQDSPITSESTRSSVVPSMQTPPPPKFGKDVVDDDQVYSLAPNPSLRDDKLEAAMKEGTASDEEYDTPSYFMSQDGRMNKRFYGKKDYGDVNYNSKGNPDPVNQNLINPEDPIKWAEDLANGKIDQTAFNNRMNRWNTAKKQDDAYKAYIAYESSDEKKAEDDAAAKMSGQVKANAQIQSLSLSLDKLEDPNSAAAQAIKQKIEDLKPLGSPDVASVDPMSPGVQDKDRTAPGIVPRYNDRTRAESGIDAESEVGFDSSDSMDPTMQDIDRTVGTGMVPEMDKVPPQASPSPSSLGEGVSEQLSKEITEQEAIVDEAKAAVETIVNDENFPDDGSTDNQTAEAATEAGKTASPEDVGKVESFLSGIFGDLFDTDELKRMAIMYVGSRVMGGTHAGAMNFSAKQYVQRVDSKVAAKKAEEKELAKEKRILDATIAAEDRAEERLLSKEERTLKKQLDLEDRQMLNSLEERNRNYKEKLSAEDRAQYTAAYAKHSANVLSIAKDNTPKSVKAYAASFDPKTQRGDPSLLIPRTAASTMDQTGTYDTYYRRDSNGKIIKVEAAEYTIETAAGKRKVLLNRNGTPINSAQFTTDKSNVKDSDEYNAKVTTNASAFKNDLDGLMLNALSLDDDGKQDKSSKPTNINASSASRDVAEWAIDNNVDMQTARRALEMAYADAVAYAKANPEKKVQNLDKFLDGSYIKATLVGQESLFRLDADGNKSANASDVKELSDRLLTAGKAAGFVTADQNDNQALTNMVNQFAGQFKVGGSYTVDDPETGNKKQITIDDKMMTVWAKEAKSRGVSPFMVWMDDRLLNDKDINS